MERLQYEFAAGLPAAGRALAGVVSSGDLEVMLEPGSGGRTSVLVLTSVNGFGPVWQALLDRVFGSALLPAACIEIHDSGATPGVARMRIEQAFEEAGQGSQP
jgi:malonate decarboxylase delta subunit